MTRHKSFWSSRPLVNAGLNSTTSHYSSLEGQRGVVPVFKTWKSETLVSVLRLAGKDPRPYFRDFLRREGWLLKLRLAGGLEFKFTCGQFRYSPSMATVFVVLLAVNRGFPDAGSGDIEPIPSSALSHTMAESIFRFLAIIPGAEAVPSPSCWLTKRFSWQFCESSLVFSCSNW